MDINEITEEMMEQIRQAQEEAEKQEVLRKEAVKNTSISDMIDVLADYLSQKDLLVEGLNMASELDAGTALMLAGLVRVRQGIETAIYWMETHESPQSAKPDVIAADDEL